MAFGSLVHYKPSSEKKLAELDKYGSRKLHGIFAGYHLHAGGRWSGDYLIIDAANYRKRLAGSRIPVYRIKEVTPVTPLKSPVKDGTIESLPEEVEETKVPLGHVPSIVEQARPGEWDHIPVDSVPGGPRRKRTPRVPMIWES